MHTLKQYNKPFEKFYSQIIELQSALYNNILLHETDRNVINAKKTLYNEMCLNSFVTGLIDPLGATVRAMRPKSLAEALDFCIKEQNINYQQGYFQKYSRYQNQQRNLIILTIKTLITTLTSEINNIIPKTIIQISCLMVIHKRLIKILSI